MTHSDRQSLHARFLAILENHQGMAQAISVQRMAEALGLGGNKAGQRMAQLIKRAVVESGHPVGSSCGKCSGWYLIVNDEEDNATLQQYRNRFFSTSQLIKRHLANRRRRESPQMAMF